MPLNYLCSLPNKRSAGRIPQIITDDPEAIAAFTHKWDIPGRGVFRCVSTLKPGATRRALDTVDELAFVHVDVDLRTLRESRDEILKQLRQWPKRTCRNAQSMSVHMSAYDPKRTWRGDVRPSVGLG
jgi:hypothetical protein